MRSYNFLNQRSIIIVIIIYLLLFNTNVYNRQAFNAALNIVSFYIVIIMFMCSSMTIVNYLKLMFILNI